MAVGAFMGGSSRTGRAGPDWRGIWGARWRSVTPSASARSRVACSPHSYGSPSKVRVLGGPQGPGGLDRAEAILRVSWV